MGWNERKIDYGIQWIDKAESVCGWKFHLDYPEAVFTPADNDEGHTDCYRAEERMRELGLEYEYICNLTLIVHNAGYNFIGLTVGFNPESNFDLIHAPCDLRCKAMLKTMEDRDGN